MAVNKDRAEGVIKSAEREFRNAVRSLEDKDYVGPLKYETTAKEILPKVKKALENCQKLIKQLFG